MAITVRTFFPVSPDYMEVNAWALAPVEESAEDSALRLDNFLTFLGPEGLHAGRCRDARILSARLCQPGSRLVGHFTWDEARRPGSPTRCKCEHSGGDEFS